MFSFKAKTGTLMGWSLVILLACFMLVHQIRQTPDHHGVFLLCLLAVFAFSWAYRLLPPMICACVFLVGSWGFHLASPDSILGGFASPFFFLMVAMALVEAFFLHAPSMERLFLKGALRFFPLTSFWMMLMVFIWGFFATFLFPSSLARLERMRHTMGEWRAYMGFKEGSTPLVDLSLYQSATLFSPFFLTGSFYNLYVLFMTSSDAYHQITWGQWFLQAAPGLLVCWGGILGFLAYAHFHTPMKMDREKHLTQLVMQNVTGNKESLFFVSGIIYLLGLFFLSLTQLDLILWTGFFAVFLSFYYPPLASFPFESMNISALVIAGALGGFYLTAHTLSLPENLIKWLSLDSYAAIPRDLFLLLFGTLVALSRWVLPYRMVVMVGGVLCVPLAQVLGIHYWTLGFCLLICAACRWKLSQGDEKTMKIPMSLLYFNLLRLLSIAASIPGWQKSGLLP